MEPLDLQGINFLQCAEKGPQKIPMVRN
uniref:Uncharacterized protein n=1 Tax=Arundo donax TaxID=35708 RepID=A0A0A9GKD7_ARUDO